MWFSNRPTRKFSFSLNNLPLQSASVWTSFLWISSFLAPFPLAPTPFVRKGSPAKQCRPCQWGQGLPPLQDREVLFSNSYDKCTSKVPNLVKLVARFPCKLLLRLRICPCELSRDKRLTISLPQGNCFSETRLSNMKDLVDGSSASLTTTFSLLLSDLFLDSSSDSCYYLSPNIASLGSDCSPSLNTFCPVISSAAMSPELTCWLMTP